MRQAVLARISDDGEIAVKLRIPSLASASPQDHYSGEAVWLKQVPVHSLEPGDRDKSAACRPGTTAEINQIAEDILRH